MAQNCLARSRNWLPNHPMFDTHCTTTAPSPRFRRKEDPHKFLPYSEYLKKSSAQTSWEIYRFTRNRTRLEDEHYLLTIDCKGKRHCETDSPPPSSVFLVFEKSVQPGDFLTPYLRPGASEPKTKYIFELS